MIMSLLEQLLEVGWILIVSTDHIFIFFCINESNISLGSNIIIFLGTGTLTTEL